MRWWLVLIMTLLSPAVFAAATKLEVQPVGPVTVGAPFSVTVHSVNAGNNQTDVNATTTVTLSLTTGTGAFGGTLTGDITAGTSSVVITGLTLDTVQTGAVITATASGGDTLAADASTAFNVLPDAPDHLTIQTEPSAAVTAGVALAQQPVVRVFDQYGNLCTNDSSTQVTVSLASGTGSVTGTAMVTAASGVVTFSGLALTGAGSSTLGFASVGLTGATSGTVVVSPAAANRLTIQTEPSANATAGDAFAQQPVVWVEDQFGNLRTGDNTTQVTVSSAGNVTGTATVTASSGVVTFSGLSVTVAGNQTLGFASGGLTGATSATVAVSPATANRLTIQTEPSASATAGTDFVQQPVVRVEDQYGNLRASDNTTQVTVSSAGNVTGTTTVTASSGVVTFSGLALTVAGNQTLGFASSGLTGATSAAVAVSPTTANRLTIQTEPSASATAGVAFAQQPVVRVEDQYGNLCAADNTTQVTVSSAGNVTGTTTVTASSGVVTFSGLALTMVGNQTLAFASGGLTGATSATVAISPAAANKLTIQTQPSANATAGVAFAQQPVVRVEDQFGNLRAADNATQITVSSAGTLTGTTTVTVSSGVATFSDLALTTSGSQTLSFASGGLTGTTSSAISVGSAGATRLVITGSATQVAGANQTLTITARDGFGNVVTGYAGSKSLVFSGPSLALLGGTAPSVTNAGGTSIAVGSATSITFTAGVASAGGVLRVVRVESISLSVADQQVGGPASAGADQLALTVTPDATHHLVVTGPTTAAAAATIALVLQAEDQFGNLATGFTQTLSVDLLGVANGNQGEVATFTDVAGTAQPTTGGANTTLQFTAGIAGAAQDPDQCVLRPMLAGVASITATGGTLIAGTALNVTVSSSTVSKLVVSGVGSLTPTAGTATTVSVAAADAGGNVVNVPADVDLTLSASPTSTSLDTGYTNARITAGTSTTTINGVTLKRAEAGVVVTVTDQAAGLTAGTSQTLAVQNDAPVLTIAGTTLNYSGGSGPVPFGLPGIAVSDSHSGGFSPYFQGTVLTASITAGLVATEDVLQVRSAGLISVSGTTVKHSNQAIATFTGGVAGTPLAVTITAATVTPAVLDDLLENLCYHNIGGVSPTLGDRTITFACSDGSTTAPGGAKSALAVTRVVHVQTGNALPVLVTNAGLSVTRGSTTAITDAALKATDQESPATGVVFQVTTFPQHGDLVLGSGMSAVTMAAGGTTSFTQDDITAGQLFYRHAGGSDLGDSFTFIVSDGTDQLPSASFSIIIPGAASNPVLILPISALNYTEGAAQPTVVLANAPYVTGTQISDADTFDFANGELTVEIVDADGVADFHAGDRLGVRSQTLTGFQQYPIQSILTNDMLQTGFIARVGDDIVRRQHPFYNYWGNTWFSLPDPGLLPFPSPQPPTIYPICWFYGTITPIDTRIAAIDLSNDGVAKGLHFSLLSGVSTGNNEPIVSSQAIAHLIDNLTYANVSDAPPSRTRYLRITLAEAAPSTSVGVATVPLVVTAQNDAPVFTIPPPGPPPVITAVAGVPLRIGVRADDPDLATGTQVSYALVSLSQPGAGVAVLNATSGALVFTPLATFTGMVSITVRATDDLGVATQAVVTINVLGGPTAAGPLVISDPPFEIIAAEDLDYSVIIRPDPAVVDTITLVTVTLVGDLPAGAAMQSSGNVLAPILHAGALTQPPDGVYTFGIRVALTYLGGAVEVGYQPVTLKVRSSGVDN